MAIKMTEEKEIERRTDEVNELLSTVPAWIVRWGIAVVFCLILTEFLLSFLIRSPDLLSAKTTVTTIHPPVTLVAKASGKIIALNYSNNEAVKKGATVLVVENTANYKDVLKISDMLDSLKSCLRRKHALPEIASIDSFQLGELTPALILFFNSYNEFKLQLETNPQLKEIAIIDNQLTACQFLQNNYQDQANTNKEELSLAEKDFERDHNLFRNQAISAREYEDKKREYLAARCNYEGLKINCLNNTITVNNLKRNRLQLQMQAIRDADLYNQNLTHAIQSLESQIEAWKQTWLLTSPVDGRISLFNFWSVHQNLKQGEEVLTIIPNEKQEAIARLLLPVRNSGKLKSGQKVNIRLDNYPSPEYGVLNGFVKSISEIPENNLFSVEVSLPDQLVTSYKKKLKYKEEMQGTAEIVTEELSVFERVFYH